MDSNVRTWVELTLAAGWYPPGSRSPESQLVQGVPVPSELFREPMDASGSGVDTVAEFVHGGVEERCRWVHWYVAESCSPAQCESEPANTLGADASELVLTVDACECKDARES